MPTSLKWRKAVSGTTAIAKGGPKSPESLARGMFPKGFPRNPGELAISPLTRAVTRSPRETRGGRACGRAVLRTHSTDEGGEPQGSARSGHGTHWREGGNRCTYLAKGNIAEAVVRQIVVHHTKRISFSLGRFFGLGLHADSSIRENARRERGLSWPGFKKRIWLSEKQLLNLRCHRITMM